MTTRRIGASTTTHGLRRVNITKTKCTIRTSKKQAIASSTRTLLVRGKRSLTHLGMLALMMTSTLAAGSSSRLKSKLRLVRLRCNQ